MKESPIVKEARKKALETYKSENAHRPKSKYITRIGGYSLYGLVMDCRKEKCKHCKTLIYVDNKIDIPKALYKYICPRCALKRLKLSALERDLLKRVQKNWEEMQS